MSTNRQWMYPLIDVRSDRSSPRTGVQQPFVHELVGTDGSLRGGVRPFPGFKKVYELDFYDDPLHDETSRVLDYKLITFDIGATGYGFGIVYLVRRSVALGADSLADVFVDFWNSKTDADGAFGTTGLKIASAVDPDAAWDCETFGQFVYVFSSGRTPAMFYVHEEVTQEFSSSSGCELPDEGSSVFTNKVFGLICDGDDNPGPGKQPFLTSPEDADPIGTFDLPEDASIRRPGHGQIVFTTTSPANNQSLPGSNSSSSSTGVSESGYSAKQLKPGDYTFAYYLFDSRTGRRSGLSIVAHAEEGDFASETDKWAALELIYDADKFDTAYVYRSLRTQGFGSVLGGAYLHLDKIVTLSEYHSIRTGTGKEFDPALTDLRHAIYYYKYEDKQLLFHTQYLGSAVVDEEMPYGGSSIFYDGCLLVSNIRGRGQSTTDGNREGDAQRGLGEMRWSHLMDLSPELFPPINRYVPKVPSNTITRFSEAGNNVIGFSEDRLYHIHKENVFILVDEMHEGYGLVNRNAADTVGSLIFYLTQRGMATIDPRGELDEVRGMDQIVQEVWAGTLGSVSVAFDPKGQFLVVHNATLKHSVFFWFRTQRMSELHDAPFDAVRRGPWPTDITDFSSTLTTRAVFLQNSPADDPDEVVSGWKPRLFVVDLDRTKEISGSATSAFNGEPRLTLLEFTGDSRLVTAQEVTGDTVTVTGANVVGTGMEGAFLYVIDSSDADYIGLKGQIKTRNHATILLLTAEGAATLNGLPAGSRVAISPIVVKLVLSPMSLIMPDGSQYTEHYMLKQIDAVAAAFTDVSGPPSTDDSNDNRFQGLAFRGTETAPSAKAFPTTTNNEKKASVVDGPSQVPAGLGASSTLLGRTGWASSSPTPGLQIICPDLDFRLLSVLVHGKIVGTTTQGLGFAVPTS